MGRELSPGCRSFYRKEALGPTEFDPAHDGRLAADIVGEWAELHGLPFALHLTGTAGGTFCQGDGCELVEMDALDLIRGERRSPGLQLPRGRLLGDPS